MQKIICLYLFSSVALCLQATAQKDTSAPGKTVVVTSSYKPVLRPAVKINLTATSPATDSSRPQLEYNVPAPVLFLSYQPGMVSPVALFTDSTVPWQQQQYVKLGYGNFRTPFAEAGFTFGKPDKGLLNLQANHISSQGQRAFQEFSRTNVEVRGITPIGNHQLTASAGYRHRLQYLYGFEPDTLKGLNVDSLRQRFGSLEASLIFQNRTPLNGLNYSPALEFASLSDSRSNSESNVRLILPVSKSVGEIFELRLHALADLTRLNPAGGSSISNNLFVLSPSLSYKTPQLKLIAGFRPSWSEQTFSWLPDFKAEYHLKNNRFYAEAGWIGQYQKNSYLSLTYINPFILRPGTLVNTRINEIFGGLKTSLGPHFTASGKVSYLKQAGTALFRNIAAPGNGFNVLFEPEMTIMQIRAEAGYTLQKKFSASAGITLRDYRNLAQQSQPWGLAPIEASSHLSWKILSDLKVKADLYFWSGIWATERTGKAFQQKAALDLNLGAELALHKNWSAFVQMNNLVNNKYQRWNQFPVLGINVLGGVVYTFGRINNP